MLIKRKQLFLLQCYQAPMHKQMDAPFLKRGPGFVLRQRGGHDHGHAVVRGGAGGKIQAHILIAQMRCGKGVAALDKAQVGGGFEYLAGKNLGVRAVAQYDLGFTDDWDNFVNGKKKDMGVRFGVGLNYYFGSKKIKN